MNTNELKQLLNNKLSKLSDENKLEIKDHFSEAIQLQTTAHQILVNAVKLAVECGISRSEIINILDIELSNSLFSKL